MSAYLIVRNNNMTKSKPDLNTFIVNDKGQVWNEKKLVWTYGTSSDCNRRHSYRQNYVYRIVAFAFCDGYFEGAVIDHIDANPSNNKPSNLRWTDQKGNLNNPINIKKLSDKFKLNREFEIWKKTEPETRYKFDCYRHADKFVGGGTFGLVLTGKRKSTQGWVGAFLEGGN